MPVRSLVTPTPVKPPREQLGEGTCVPLSTGTGMVTLHDAASQSLVTPLCPSRPQQLAAACQEQVAARVLLDMVVLFLRAGLRPEFSRCSLSPHTTMGAGYSPSCQARSGRLVGAEGQRAQTNIPTFHARHRPAMHLPTTKYFIAILLLFKQMNKQRPDDNN